MHDFIDEIIVPYFVAEQIGKNVPESKENYKICTKCKLGILHTDVCDYFFYNEIEIHRSIQTELFFPYSCDEFIIKNIIE